MESINGLLDILYRFNSIDKSVKFTLETSINNNINFLDLNIQIINNKIYTNWYRKPIWSGRYINIFSNHSLSHKIGIIYSLTDRAILLSNKCFHIDNLNCVRSTLLKNGYPLQLLSEKIFQRCREIISNQHKTFSMNKIYNIDNQENRKIIIFPYIQNFQEQLSRIFRTYNLQIIFIIENTLQKNFFSTRKDKIQRKFKYNIIYEINCIQCNKKYIGQTCRFLHNRLLEHARYIKNE